MEPTTPNLGLTVPNIGDLVGTWGPDAINPDFVAIDGMLGGSQTISLGDPATILLTTPDASLSPSAGPNQSQNACLFFTGTLTGNSVIQLTMPGRYVMHNACLPWDWYVQVSSVGGGTAVGLPPGKKVTLFHDGTNVDFVDVPDVGSRLDLMGVTQMPAWMFACSTLPYLIRDGNTYNVADFPMLGAFLGNTFGGDGVTTFGVPDSRERVDVAWAGIGSRLSIFGTGMGNAGGDQNLQTHYHPGSTVTINDPGHAHGLSPNPLAFGGPNPGPFSNGGSNTPVGSTQASGTGITATANIATIGSGNSQNVQPSIISFLGLIKT